MHKAKNPVAAVCRSAVCRRPSARLPLPSASAGLRSPRARPSLVLHRPWLRPAARTSRRDLALSPSVTASTSRGAGYVNLLQPQDRKSPEAGDSREAVEARASLVAAGIGRGAHRHGGARARTRSAWRRIGGGGRSARGTGDALGAAASRWPLTYAGIDLSTAAVEHAARRFPSVTWVVANADRGLPLTGPQR